MRYVQISDKWAMVLQDPYNGVLEEYKPPRLFRYEGPMIKMPNNVEIAAAQRIIQLEDALNEIETEYGIDTSKYKELKS